MNNTDYSEKEQQQYSSDYIIPVAGRYSVIDNIGNNKRND